MFDGTLKRAECRGVTRNKAGGKVFVKEKIEIESFWESLLVFVNRLANEVTAIQKHSKNRKNN